MRITAYLLTLVTFVAIGLLAVQQQLRSVRAGYRLAALEHERAELRERRRRLEVKRLAESRLDALEQKARALGLEIPGERDPARILEELLDR